MTEKGFTYSDSLIQSIVGLFEVRIKNLEKSILQSVPLRKRKRRRSPRKGKLQPLKGLRMKTQIIKKKENCFASTIACTDIPLTNALPSRHQSNRQNRKGANTSRKKRRTPEKKLMLW